MDFYQIEQILAVAKTGSISEAARLMCVSQPTMSYAVSKAEQEFGAKFFDRSSYPLKLTFAGEQYVQTAQEMKRLRRDLEKVCLDVSRQAAGKLHIGIPHNRSAQILPRILREYESLYPHIQLDYYSTSAEELMERLARGELDLCILTKVDQDPRFRYEGLYTEELLAAAAEGVVQPRHLLAENHQVLRLEALSELPLLLPNARSGLGKMLQKLFEYYDIVPPSVRRLDANNALYSLAAAGLGVAILPQNVIRQSAHAPHLKTYSLSGRGVGWTVCAIFRRDATISEAENTLLTLIRREFASPHEQLDLFPHFSGK